MRTSCKGQRLLLQSKGQCQPLVYMAQGVLNSLQEGVGRLSLPEASHCGLKVFVQISAWLSRWAGSTCTNQERLPQVDVKEDVQRSRYQIPSRVGQKVSSPGPSQNVPMHSCPTQTIPIYARHPIGCAATEDPGFSRCTICTLRLRYTPVFMIKGGMPLESGIF